MKYSKEAINHAKLANNKNVLELLESGGKLYELTCKECSSQFLSDKDRRVNCSNKCKLTAFRKRNREENFNKQFFLK